MNTPINFPIAKLLKEKGFDSVMKEHYTKEQLVISDIVSKYNWNKFTDMAGNSYYCSAPTIADVVMWLYKEHGIWTEVRRTYSGNKFVAVTKNPRIELSSNNSPTEAYSSGIEYTLKNLI